MRLYIRVNSTNYPSSPGCKLCELGVTYPLGYVVSKRSRLARRLGSMVARLKLKGIGGGAPQGVRRAVQSNSTQRISPGATAG
jgi:hypothetical protein